jgi:hypothetical protein
MFERLSNSWQLVKASAAVLRADRELLFFPVYSAILSLIVVCTFAVPAMLSDAFHVGTNGKLSILPVGYLIVFLFYVAQYFVIFFCNTALVGAAMIRLRGGDPTVSDGFEIAASKTREILEYAVLAATVGMVLRAISERSGLLGRLVVSFVGMGWNLATYLAVPVLVMEDVGPLEAIRQSAEYLKNTWGEQIIGNAGIGLVFGLISLVPIGAGVLVFVEAIRLHSEVLAVGAAVGVALALVAISVVGSALSGIYAAALYRYAAEGEIVTFFTPDILKDAFRRR